MSRIGSAATTASPGIPSGTRNAPRSAGSARRSCNRAANSSASAAVYNSTSPAKRPPNGTSANPEYTNADTSTALRGVPRASVTASAAGNRPSCASTNGIREYASSNALKSANALTSPAPASQTPSHGPTTAVASLGHAPSVHGGQSVSASTTATNHPDAVPTTRVPRRLSQVAPQISASATSHASNRPSAGRKKRKYCRNRTG